MISVENHLREQGKAFGQVLDFLRSNVFAAGCFNEVFFAIRDEEIAILIEVAEGQDEQARATAQSVEQRLANGEDFAAIAAEVSADAGTKAQGGDQQMAADNYTLSQTSPQFRDIKRRVNGGKKQ